MFFAVVPPEEARQHLGEALTPLRDLPGAPRWGRRERWHLTLLFLAEVPEELVPELVAAAGPAVSAAPPMVLRLAGSGRFGSARRPQVAWAGIDGDVAPLDELAGRLARAAREFGLPGENRAFQPHLTLGRWKPGRPADATLTDRLAGYRGPAWPVTEVQLLESRLGGRAPYEVVTSWPVT
ncbi:RNA 2',3'-cyclic phosphodiesterase [Blastococcus sp. TBT05-19]|uniref:RNA 2',3'-cyclic phosphodiesterase n=1 Tax=Blastococcus sp. TBT05-19 TaxID=2250581 RepID=UPI00272B38A1|nr:RNA 2',3'-cyclic phosphodiesterase [Blastococcus sp. TBT05-19]